MFKLLLALILLSPINPYVASRDALYDSAFRKIEVEQKITISDLETELKLSVHGHISNNVCDDLQDINSDYAFEWKLLSYSGNYKTRGHPVIEDISFKIRRNGSIMGTIYLDWHCSDETVVKKTYRFLLN